MSKSKNSVIPLFILVCIFPLLPVSYEQVKNSDR